MDSIGKEDLTYSIRQDNILMVLAFGTWPSELNFRSSQWVSFPKYLDNLGDFFLPVPPPCLMLIKAECLISSRWSVNLNYLFVFLFTVSVCLQFFLSLWRSVIGVCVSFWRELLPYDLAWWYGDDLLIYGFFNQGIWRHCREPGLRLT